ncbi:hypothetical protein BDQ17DRAFT_1414163 [Cyathus striatus]|nr:hypothetical protein BDQ17DRAFT_1414163 [Cyathus striatus]
MTDVPKTFGALLAGGIVSAILSGAAIVQTFAYFKFYQRDHVVLKMLVFAVWLMDICHIIFVTYSVWFYVIENFGKPEMIDYITWSLALTMGFTAILIFLVHIFFVYRIHKLSKGDYRVSVPLGIITCARLGFACLMTDKMITLKSFDMFIVKCAWVLTTGLALAAILDVLITACLCYYLKSKQNEYSSLNNILDSLMLYAFESGSLTCATTLATLVCWITMKHNLIFLGLHFIISKCYANSLLASLNSRKILNHTSGSRLQPSSTNDHVLPVMFPEDFRFSRSPGGRRLFSRYTSADKSMHKIKPETIQLEVNVEKTTMCDIDEGDVPVHHSV